MTQSLCVCVSLNNMWMGLGTGHSQLYHYNQHSTDQSEWPAGPVHKVFMNQPTWGISPMLQYVATIALHPVPWCNPSELFKRGEWSTLQAHPQEGDVGNFETFDSF